MGNRETNAAVRQKTQKNSFIELERFLACLIIFSFHTEGIFISGWIFVEFFFMLSGYFAIKHFQDHPDQDSQKANRPVSYTMRKFRRLLPYTTAAFLYNVCVVVWIYQLRGKDLLLWLAYLPLNILLLPGTGVMPSGVTVTEYLYTGHMMEESLWYICVMIVALPIMLYIITYLWKKFGLFLVSFLPLLLYGYLILLDGTIHGWHEQHLTFFALDIRALAGLLMGGGVYYASLWWRRHEFTPLGKLLLTMIELGSMVMVAAFAVITRLPYDIVEVLLITLSLSLTLSERTYTAYIRFKPFAWLGRLSLPVYCLHCTTYLLISQLYPQRTAGTRALITLGIVLSASVVLDLAVEKGRKPIKNLTDKIRHLLIADYINN